MLKNVKKTSALTVCTVMWSRLAVTVQKGSWGSWCEWFSENGSSVVSSSETIEQKIRNSMAFYVLFSIILHYK